MTNTFFKSLYTKIIILTLITVLAFGFVSIADTTTSPVLKTYLSLEDVIEISLAYNLDVKSQEIELNSLNRDLKDAKDAKSDASYSGTDADNYETYLLEKYNNVNEIETKIDLKTREIETLKNSVSIDVTELYIDYFQVSKLLSNAKADRDNAQVVYNQLIQKRTLGLVTDSDLMNANINLLQKELIVKSKENEISQISLHLCQYLGYPIDTLISLQSVEIPNVEINYNVIGLSDNITNYSSAVYDAEKQYEIALNKYKLIDDNKIKTSTNKSGVDVDGYSVPTDYFTLRTNADNAKIDLDNVIKDETLNLYIDYYNLRSSAITVEINKLNYDAAVRNFNTAKVKYDLGMVTDYDLDLAKASQDTAYQTYIQSINDLYIQDLEFQNSIGIYGVEDTSTTLQ